MGSLRPFCGREGRYETQIHAQDLVFPAAGFRSGLHAQRLCVLSGTSFSLIEQIAFAAAGIAALFLAAEKGSTSWEKRNFTGVFVLLMVSYMVNGWAGYLCSALAWPLLLSTEYKRGMAVQRSCSWWVPPKRSTCLPADGEIRRHGRAGLLDEPALGAAGLRPGLGSAEPL